FWYRYREDPFPLYSLGFGFAGHVNALEPPPRAGSVRAQFDSHGHLLLIAAPPVTATAAPPRPQPQREDAFAAAGLDMNALEKTAPGATPISAGAGRRPWLERNPVRRAGGVRLEPAQERGSVSYFQWCREPQRTVPSSDWQWSTIGAILLCAISALVVFAA